MDRRKWLQRLIVVRIVTFTVFVAAERSIDMLVLLGAVYALTLCWGALFKLNQNLVSQAYAQIAVDLVLITWTVNRTGGLDSYFSSLYFLEIVMSSILLERRGSFITAAGSSLLHGVHLDLAYFNVLPSQTATWPPLVTLQFIVGVSIFGFFAVGFLTNFLADNLRRTGAELEKSTDQIAYLREFSDRIVDSLGSGVITTDRTGRVSLFNRAAERITGFAAAETTGGAVYDLLPGLPRQVDSGRFEVATRTKDGSEIHLRFTVSPLMVDRADGVGYVWCFDDLTEIKDLERQIRRKERMAAIGVMSAGIAHEIRNPLASISGSFNLLKSELQLDADQRRLTEIIQRETERLNRIIDNFLLYARPLNPKPEPIRLDALVSETVELIRHSPEVKASHLIEMNLDPVTASVDGGLMRQVFYNLASNAFRAMPSGGTLRIRLAAANGETRIEFEDTGVGLTEQEVDQLFVPFNSSFRNGTGLGLSIVYQIVAAHNGTISVSSRKQAGTAIMIHVPNPHH